MNPIIYYTVSVGVYSLVVFASCTIGDISIVFGIVGSTAVSFIAYIGPASFFLKSAYIAGETPKLMHTILAWIILLFGFVNLFACNFAVIYTAASK